MTMFRWFKRLEAVQTMSYIKPQLQDHHVQTRLQFIINKLVPTQGMHRLIDHSRYLHVDEKWFFAVRTHKRLKLLPGQEFVAETTRHKSHIMKVMFVAVVGMPQTLPDGTFFDGKIGVFPVIKITQAKRKSKNRDAGADVVENVSMSAEEYLNIMTKEGGILATFQTQPAQSPDLNICDLCFFNSLQKRSFELRSKSNTEMELMNTVQQAWAEYDWETLERAWGLLFAVYRAVLDAKGTNQYVKPHSGVRVRQHDGAGTLDPYVSQDTWLTAQEALDALNNAQH